MQTVSITDYDLVSPKLARVVIAFTGKFNKETLRASLTEKFEAKAAPVEDSFREVREALPWASCARTVKSASSTRRNCAPATALSVPRTS